MQKIIHRAGERGEGNHGWLQTRFSFSFADWYEPTRMGFGALRVLNDDHIAPLGKFDMHPHRNFEIITIPLSGAVTHEDNMGNMGTVHAGEVQAMSAGTGVVHSEYNASKTEPLSLFQIWIEPNIRNAEPRYAQTRFDPTLRKNAWQFLVSGDGTPGTLPIYQHARIAWTDMDAKTSLVYTIAHEGNGAYVIVVEGEVKIDGEHLSKRDAIGLSETARFSISATTPATVLVIEVPVQA